MSLAVLVSCPSLGFVLGASSAEDLMTALVGRIEFDVDPKRARWYTEWLALQEGAVPSRASSSEDQHPATAVSRARSPSGPSLSYILPQTPATSSCSSLRGSTSPSPRRPAEEHGPLATGGTALRDPPTFEPRTSTPISEPEAPSSLRKASSNSPFRPRSTTREVDWTEQLDRLRDINEHALLDGVEHPSQLVSIEGTETLGQLFGSLVDRTVQPSALEACAPDEPTLAERWIVPKPEVVARAIGAQQAGSDQPRVSRPLILPSQATSPGTYPNLVIYPAAPAPAGLLQLQTHSATPSSPRTPSLVSTPSVSAGSDSDAAAELFESYYAPEAEQPSSTEEHRAQPSQVWEGSPRSGRLTSC